MPSLVWNVNQLRWAVISNHTKFPIALPQIIFLNLLLSQIGVQAHYFYSTMDDQNNYYHNYKYNYGKKYLFNSSQFFNFNEKNHHAISLRSNNRRNLNIINPPAIIAMNMINILIYLMFQPKMMHSKQYPNIN